MGRRDGEEGWGGVGREEEEEEEEEWGGGRSGEGGRDIEGMQN
jgi:hypothetical protein